MEWTMEGDDNNSDMAEPGVGPATTIDARPTRAYVPPPDVAMPAEPHWRLSPLAETMPVAGAFLDVMFLGPVCIIT